MSRTENILSQKNFEVFLKTIFIAIKSQNCSLFLSEI